MNRRTFVATGVASAEFLPGVRLVRALTARELRAALGR